MTPRFETINGTLCMMLEKPIPLCASIKYPYVISGKKTKHPSIVTQDMDALLRIFIIAYSDEFEVIGYPVVPNSAEWALYRMMQGDMVCQKDNFKRHYKNGNVRWLDRAGIERSLTTDLFLKNFADTSDWQIYAEKPLLADAKVGDLCQRRDGKWVQIDGIPPETLYWEAGNQLYYQEGNLSLDREDEKDIIHTEPIAPEGSTEWAGQMLKLGKMVKYEGNKYPHSLDIDGKVYYCHEYRESQGLLQEWIIGRVAKTGWQLYEPKPKPLPSPGSQEWALEAMKEGYKITGTNTGCIVYWEMVHDTIYMRYKSGKNDPNVIGFPTYSWGSNLEENGFMIYEPTFNPCHACNGTGIEQPKPLLADAKDGDKVRLRNGIIWELKIGKNAIRKGFDYMVCSQTNDVYGYCRTSREESPYDIVELIPKPQFKVGDWVEFNPGNNPHQVQIKEIKGDKLHYANKEGRKSHIYSSIVTRKLKPSEVVVDFGSGIKGTIEYTTIIVRSNGTKQIDKSWVSVHEGDFIIAKYQINKLKEPLQGIVKKLLKAQEEE